MSLELFGGFLVLVVLAGFFWHRQNVRLAAALFGDDYRLRYVQGRWVLEGEIEGAQIRYATGGMGLFPALTYLLVETRISEPFSVVGDTGGSTGEETAGIIRTLRDRDGFRRLDGLSAGSAPVAATGRVRWLHAGDGLLLRRYTRRGGDADYVLDDVRLLRGIAGALSR